MCEGFGQKMKLLVGGLKNGLYKLPVIGFNPHVVKDKSVIANNTTLSNSLVCHSTVLMNGTILALASKKPLLCYCK